MPAVPDNNNHEESAPVAGYGAEGYGEGGYGAAAGYGYSPYGSGGYGSPTEQSTDALDR
jgi:hypothetical protein